MSNEKIDFYVNEKFPFRPYPGSGNIVTFAQFLFIAIEGFINYYKWGREQRHVPIKYLF